MRDKTNPILIFLYSFVFSLVILIFTAYLIFYAQGNRFWLQELLTLKITVLPAIAYLILISLVVGAVVAIVYYFMSRYQIGKIEEKLGSLARDNYENPIFNLKESDYDDVMTFELNRNIKRVREKMMSMSKELQILAARPELVDGESKEDILREERHRLARELHDSVSQQLFAASMMMSAVMLDVKKKNGDEMVQKQLGLIEGIINASQSEMRALLLHLRPITLEGKSLKKGIEQLLKELETKIKIEMIWHVEDVKLPTAMEDNLFRIVQELLSNTLRHAKATTLEVYLKKIDEMVMLRVVDDGVGFDTTQTKVGSYGINNIHERAAQMGGTSKIISFKGSGTSVEIRIPLVGESDKDD